MQPDQPSFDKTEGTMKEYSDCLARIFAATIQITRHRLGVEQCLPYPPPEPADSTGNYATEADFPGLHYSVDDDCGPIVALRDLDQIIENLEVLRFAFKRLQDRGVPIPKAFLIENEAESWGKLIYNIAFKCYLLQCIVTMMLDQNSRELDEICCG
jgi:hypothetical protein